ncbi:MAG: CIA30 family protein [Bacteroidota bacterium]
MKIFIVLLSLIIQDEGMTVFDFNAQSVLRNWAIVDDVVMGGRSNGQFQLDSDGHGWFHGYVSTENYGGFSSVRFNSGTLEINAFQTAEIRLKGDGKFYQFRCKTKRYDPHSYIYDFQTTGEWETIEIPLHEMKPRFRGRQLNMPDYPANFVEEIAFLIGNKKNEEFSLQIDYIKFK